MGTEKKILLAEDDNLLRKSVALFLSGVGFKVTQAANGREATYSVQNDWFDLIITDLNMPYSGGLELIQLVHNDLRQKTPVIVLTVSGIESVELDSLSIGADDFITKPFSLSVLKARVDRVLYG
ncbi:MAG: response regulator [Chitinophagaceae bacterium]|nr:MAG: response regulator [Chitinophagaceae bacterium]